MLAKENTLVYLLLWMAQVRAKGKIFAEGWRLCQVPPDLCSIWGLVAGVKEMTESELGLGWESLGENVAQGCIVEDDL